MGDIEGEKTEVVAPHIFEEYENVLKVTILMNAIHCCCKLNGAPPILSFQINREDDDNYYLPNSNNVNSPAISYRNVVHWDITSLGLYINDNITCLFDLSS